MVTSMALRWAMAVAMALLSGVAAAQQAPELQTEKEKISYALGMGLAKQLQGQSIEVDPEVLSQGLKDALSSGKTLLTEEAARNIVAGVQKELKSKQSAVRSERARVLKELGEKNQKDGDAFLAENKAREGVITLASGLQYKILTKGDGERPTLEDTVICHYRGTLVDGTEFDSSHARKQPATLPVKKLIKGWSEGLQFMPVGSTWQFVIPANLAYGERGVGNKIAPHATLVFDVELIAIKEAAVAQTKGATDPKAAAGTDSSQTSTGTAGTAAKAATPTPRLTVSFKMDPRLATGTYGSSDRWVSPPTYTRVGDENTCTVEARVLRLDAHGKPVTVRPTWTATDPEMVVVTPSEGNAVTILVQRAGESRVRVDSEGVSKELTIKAAHRNNALHVDISQK
jgi:FKBP-type peptidyl-prolyl cis-trans isomerase